MKNETPLTVDAYLLALPAEQREALQKLRAIIKQAAPNAGEAISYKMPAFKHLGMLVYYAAFTNHCSFFVGSKAVLSAFATELEPYKTSTGTLQFTPDKPLPTTLIKKLVKARIAENEVKAAKKKVR